MYTFKKMCIVCVISSIGSMKLMLVVYVWNQAERHLGWLVIVNKYFVVLEGYYHTISLIRELSERSYLSL